MEYCIPAARKCTRKSKIQSVYIDTDFVYAVCIYLDAAAIPKQLL